MEHDETARFEDVENLYSPKKEGLYEKLYSENERLKESEYKRNCYTSKWKKRFEYDDSVSFDKVLEDLFFLKYGKKLY